MRFAVLPMKPLAIAKSRLAAALTTDERQAVSFAMFHDVLDCLTRAHSIEGVVVVTADRRLLDLANGMRAIAVDEEKPRGLNAAAALGTARAIAAGATSVLIVLSDLPFLVPEEVDSVYADLPPAPHVRLVRSHEGIGTNVLLRTPPSVISTRFGGRSFQDHISAAADAGVSHSSIEVPGLAFDVDTPEDLRELSRVGRPTRTLVEAQKIGIVPARAG
jgi:2-phospho-L-lactate guanylyltransferase